MPRNLHSFKFFQIVVFPREAVNVTIPFESSAGTCLTILVFRYLRRLLLLGSLTCRAAAVLNSHRNGFVRFQITAARLYKDISQITEFARIIRVRGIIRQSTFK